MFEGMDMSQFNNYYDYDENNQKISDEDSSDFDFNGIAFDEYEGSAVETTEEAMTTTSSITTHSVQII